VHFDDENSGFADGFHVDFRGHGGGRRAGHNDQRARGERRNGRVFTLLMKRKFIVNLKMGNLMIMKIFLLTMGILDSTMIVIEVLVMMEDIIVVVTIGMIRKALLESS